jgi:hypothetical protein
VVRAGAKQMEVQMSQYDNYRDDEIIDKVDNEYTLGSGGSFPKGGVSPGIGIGALVALVVIVLIAWNTGFVQVEPYRSPTTVTDLPISPTLVPTPQPLPPKS